MKIKVKHFTIIMLLICFALSTTYALEDELTSKERIWLEDNKGKTFYLGVSHFYGKSYFILNNTPDGYIFDVIKCIEDELNIHIEIVAESAWETVLKKLKAQKTDLILGANKSESRLKYMCFTYPIVSNPYAVLVLKGSKIKTLGDMDGQKIGFLNSDISIELFKKNYNKINVNTITYNSHPEIIEALLDRKIDGFITQAGGIEKEFLLDYPDIIKITNLNNVNSDMSFAALKKNQMLINLIEKILIKNQYKIQNHIKESRILYNYKLLNFTSEELDWIKKDGIASVAIVNNYLPFDYYKNGQYLGVAGEIFNEISNQFGIEFEYYFGEFDELYEMAIKGEIDIINIAKSKEREQFFYFTRPLAEEIDVIYGRNTSHFVNDIYGLNGKKVAVIDGFWHYNLLQKNLVDVSIVKSKNIMESIALVSSGKADYFIENPTVAEYYINGLGFNNIEKKGITASDSFLYLGVNKKNKTLASIIDKSLCVVDYQKAKENGLKTVPKLLSKNVKRLVIGIFILIVIIIIIGIFLYEVIKSLIRAHETTAVLKEREKLLFIDPLTHIKNRMYFNSIRDTLENTYPLAIIIMDLNDLKIINDTFGHVHGDLYLATFAKILKSVFSKDETMRMGGDEFYVIVKNATTNDIVHKINALKFQLQHSIIKNDKKQVESISVAIGFSIRKDDKISLDKAIIEADNNMYKDKTSNKSL